MNPEQREQFGEIRRLLKEAYDDYFARGDGGDKSSEGYVEVYYQNVFETSDYLSDEACGLGIYSYVLGPSRMHHFDTFGHALDTVRRWHAEQLSSESA